MISPHAVFESAYPYPPEVEPDDPDRCAWSGCLKRGTLRCPVCGGRYCTGCFSADRESHQEAGGNDE